MATPRVSHEHKRKIAVLDPLFMSNIATLCLGSGVFSTVYCAKGGVIWCRKSTIEDHSLDHGRSLFPFDVVKKLFLVLKRN